MTESVHIVNLKLDQVQWEINSMKRRLGFIRDENTHLKNRLSDILAVTFDKDQLEIIEHFQNRFIIQDGAIALLINQLAELNSSFIHNTPTTPETLKEINSFTRLIQDNLSLTEDRSKKLIQEFNNYLSEKI